MGISDISAIGIGNLVMALLLAATMFWTMSDEEDEDDF